MESKISPALKISTKVVDDCGIDILDLTEDSPEPTFRPDRHSTNDAMYCKALTEVVIVASSTQFCNGCKQRVKGWDKDEKIALNRKLREVESRLTTALQQLDKLIGEHSQLFAIHSVLEMGYRSLRTSHWLSVNSASQPVSGGGSPSIVSSNDWTDETDGSGDDETNSSSNATSSPLPSGSSSFDEPTDNAGETPADSDDEPVILHRYVVFEHPVSVLIATKISAWYSTIMNPFGRSVACHLYPLFENCRSEHYRVFPVAPDGIQRPPKKLHYRSE